MSIPSAKKVLIIGSGPITIGQTGAYDDAACQACRVYREAGYKTVMVHCDPSALAADLETADRTYFLPLTVPSLTEVILREKPDAILPTMGGPRAIRIVQTFVKKGIFKGTNAVLAGLSENAILAVDDPTVFCDTVKSLGLAATKGISTESIADAVEGAERIGYPVFARACHPGGTLRYGIVYNVEELRSLIAGGRLPFEREGLYRVERALAGHTEIEVELLRDSEGRIALSMAENIEPVGIHSGDSTAVTPPVSIGESTRKKIEGAACRLANAFDVKGAMHVKFAVSTDSEKILVLSVDPCFSRMTGFFAKASGIPLSEVHAKLSVGLDLEEALSPQPSISSLVPANVVAVHLPRWEFERFPGETATLNARMKSTGAVMGLGKTFLEAFQKALRARSPLNPVLGGKSDLKPLSLDALMRKLVLPKPDGFSVILEALKKGAEPEAVSKVTGIRAHWIHQLSELDKIEKGLSACCENKCSASQLKKAAANGFSAREVSFLTGKTEKTAEQWMINANLKAGPCSPGSKDNETAPVLFKTLAGNDTRYVPSRKTVLLVGPGPGRIGQSIEMDHCCSRGAKSLHAAGRRVALVNGNPGSACGLLNVDRTYVEPLTSGDVKAICEIEKPEGVILQFGGYRAMAMAKGLSASGYTVLGTPQEQVSLTQDRLNFNHLLKELGIAHTQMGVASNLEQALDMAESIGYPLMARPQVRNKWRQRTIIMEPRMMENHLKDIEISTESPLLLEQFLEYAIEVEADALCDGSSVYVPSVMEHIELAGVHSGDAAMVVPPYSTPPRHVETITAYIQKVALKIGVQGIINARFAVYNDTVYLLEARPWACRTVPMVSKMCNVPMAERAVEIMLGMTLEEMDLPRRMLPYYGIRASVFPYDTFTKTDPLLGPRMRSTGQTMVFSEVFGMAYFTAQEAARPALPLSGDVLITVTDEDKPSILEPARLYSELGFGLQATRGTHAFLKKNGIEAKLVKKVGFGRPDLVDGIKTGEVALVVNTPSGRQSHQDDAYIRNTAIRYGIPNITTPAGALASAKGIAARKKGQDALCTLQSYVRAIR